MAFGVLTGDVMVQSTPEYWDSAIIDMNELTMPVYIAAGNYDIGPAFINIFEHYYFSFKQNDDLFIVLTPGLVIENSITKIIFFYNRGYSCGIINLPG